MIGKWLARCAAVLALVGFMIVAGDAQAAVSGTVVGHKGHGVSGATVKVAKHKHKKHKHKKKHKKHKGKKAVVHAGHHKGHAAVSHATTSGAKGHFTIQANGGTLVAHKRGVGSGRAAASNGTTIVLHKHHHHHSGAATTHAKHKHKHHKKGKGGKKTFKAAV